MTPSNNCLALIKQFEGFRAAPYRCPAGVPTIGYGSTYYTDGRAVKMTDPAITEAQADAMLRATLGRYADAVTRYAQVPLAQSQFDALVSFAYNVGNENLRTSTLLRLLNQGDYAGAQAQFGRWNRGGGQVLPGLVRRRQAEAALFGGA